MACTLPARTISIAIDAPPGDVYAFVRDPNNLPRWATAFCMSVRQAGGDWFIETPAGAMSIRFVPENEFGVLDHVVSPGPGVSVYVPMRVIANHAGSEVLFTLLRTPGMSDERFANDARMIERDLATLKRVVETR